MKDGCKVSVVMAVYNAGKYLPEAVESVLNQSLKEIELICVDDGSTDGSMEMLRKYEKMDSRVHIYQTAEPSDGAGLARNLGICHATGEYLSVLDSDDFFEERLLDTVYRKAVQCHADVVLYDAYLYDEKLRVDSTVNWLLSVHDLPPGEVFSPSENADRLFQMTIGAAWNAMFSREFVSSSRLSFESIHHADDLGFVYLAFAMAKRIAVVRERLLHYRRNREGSQSASLGRWPLTGYEAMRRLQEKLKERGAYERHRRSFVNKAVDYALFYLDSLTDAESFDRLYAALQGGGLERLDAFTLSPKEFIVPEHAARRDMICRMSPEAYLLQWHQGRREVLHDALSGIPLGSRIALYGAGRRGSELYSTLLRGQEFKVCAWVDRNHRELGFPVQPPESLDAETFDYVLITIQDEHVVQQVRESLMGQGIPSDRILLQESGTA